MKILIIDNGTSYLSQLKNLLSDHDFSVVRYSEIQDAIIDGFDAVILSGGHDFPVSNNTEQLGKEIALVNTSSKPIFGICLGFEIIAYALGAKLERMQNKERGILDIDIVEPDKIFSNILNFKVYENHRWVVKQPTDEMLVLARSKNGIEVFKHKTRLIYAVQFHPEMFIEKTCGNEIFDNFLKQVEVYNGS